jgi:hypothetical protein
MIRGSAGYRPVQPFRGGLAIVGSQLSQAIFTNLGVYNGPWSAQTTNQQATAGNDDFFILETATGLKRR